MKAKLPIVLASSLLIAGSTYADGNIIGTVFNKNAQYQNIYLIIYS